MATMAINLGHCLVELGQAKAAVLFVFQIIIFRMEAITFE